MENFTGLGLKRDVITILDKLKFKKPFEVQEKVIPLAINGTNVVFTSRTGSGKTLAYLLGYINKINLKLGPQMIVLVPTRELCIQVGKEIKRICDPLGINTGVFYGGRDVPGDYKVTSRKNQIIIGTPGRLILHINEKRIKVGDAKYIVYDESDQMFDNGFYDDCVYMKKRASKNAQLILSSATLTNKVKIFIQEEIRYYELLQIGDIIPKNIKQEKLYCEIPDKNAVLLDLFANKRYKRAIIFCNTKEKSYSIRSFLEDNNINAKSLSSDLLQQERIDHLNLFKDGKIRVLVTTDVAARGLNIEKVDIVINYDIPTKDEFYVHRIGRTGRKDKKGYSLALICKEDIQRFENIQEEFDVNITQIQRKDVQPYYKKYEIKSDNLDSE